MTIEQLERAATALYGGEWKHDLARHLQVNVRNVRRWANNEGPVPLGIWPEIRRLLIEHSLRCRDIAVTLPSK